jgi:hypothetical protein
MATQPAWDFTSGVAVAKMVLVEKGSKAAQNAG